jgi:hypothetical protein
MKAVFELPSGVTPADIIQYFADNGIAGFWDCDELNIFRMNGTYTNEKWDLMAAVCSKPFEIKGKQVRAHMIMKRKP